MRLAQGLRLLAALTAYRLYIGSNHIPLPYPAHLHTFADIDPSTLPLDPAPLEGVYAPNTLLQRAHLLFEGKVHAAETLAISPGGNLTLLDKYGYLYEAAPTGGPFPHEWKLDETPRAYLGPGRPMGVQYDAEGNLVFCDALRGLMMLEKASGKLVTLANRVSSGASVDPGSHISFTNGLEVSRETGAIYFSETQAIPVDLFPGGGVGAPSFYSIFHGFLFGMLSGAPTGRLLRYDPSTAQTEVLAGELWYGNGVALSEDEDFVLVVESIRTRVMRHWLKGPKAGTTDVFVDRLPGFPDGVSRAPDGGFWVALVAPVTRLPHALKFKALRVLLAYLPDWARPPLKHWGALVKLSPEGAPLRFLHDPKGGSPGHAGFLSSVLEVGDRIYLGNVQQSYVAVLDARQLD